MKTMKVAFIVVLCCGNFVLGFSQTQQAALLRAGAAKVDITPPEEILPEATTGIHDRLFCRTVVIDNGLTSAALISVDQIAVSSDFYNRIIQQIEEEMEIPALNIFISPSHTHSGFMGNNPNAENGVIEAVRQAKAQLQPARISYNTGLSYININRDVINPVTRLWSQGPNYDGPSDKTVAVIKFEALNGDPIAVCYNYAMHANTMFMTGVISADFPGETSKYIEEYYEDKIVALFSSGAAGDQNPMYFPPTNRTFDRRAQMIATLGQLLGEEVLRVMRMPQRADSTIQIYASQETVTCPGRTRTDTGNREGSPGSYVDGDPVDIKLSLLSLGDIALAAVNAEVYTVIAQRLKKESPFNNTIFVAITNGNSYSGYIPSDDAFQRYTFQVLGSRLEPNCAENAIINGLLDLMDDIK